MAKSAISPRPTPEFEISSDFFENKIYNSIVLFFCKKKKIVVEKSWKKPSTGFTNNTKFFFFSIFSTLLTKKWAKELSKFEKIDGELQLAYYINVFQVFYVFFASI